MSRIGKKPITLTKGVEAKVDANSVTIKASKGSYTLVLNPHVAVKNDNGTLHVEQKSDLQEANAASGTTRALLANAVKGVTEGFSKKLELVGVDHRTQGQGNNVNLTLGFAHPDNYKVLDGMTIET